jgi:hypothetical protein
MSSGRVEKDPPRLQVARRVPGQHPADRQRCLTAVIPQRRPTDGLQRPLGPVVPPDRHGLPDRLRIGQDHLEVRQPDPPNARATDGARPAFGRWFEQPGVQPQWGDQSDAAPSAGQAQFDDTVGRIVDDRQIGPGQPAADAVNH